MTKRYVHYEAAFEDYVRSEGVPFIPVNEARRAAFDGSPIKSFDFLVHARDGTRWLVDVKGRRFPHMGRRGVRYWENWVTVEDLEHLERWCCTFGEGFRAAFVFAYWLSGPAHRWPEAPIHVHRGRRYAFLAIPLEEYRARCYPRSPRWETFSVPRRAFRERTYPVDSWWHEATAAALRTSASVYNDPIRERQTAYGEGVWV